MVDGAALFSIIQLHYMPIKLREFGFQAGAGGKWTVKRPVK